MIAATNLAQAVDVVEVDINRLTAEGKLDVATFLTRLAAVARGLTGRAPADRRYTPRGR